VKESAELEPEGPPAGVKIDHVVGSWHEFRGDEMRDPLGHRSVRRAWKFPIEIAPIERR
jgi:hypothetical protein